MSSIHVPRRALIVHAHPEPTSFSSAQAEAARATLTAHGHEVEVLDLYARGWHPVLEPAEFAPVEGAFKPQREQQAAARAGTLHPDVQADLDALLRADLLVLSFPLWWFSVPAVLKGWIDRVFVMGAVFGGDHGLFEQAALAGRRAVALVTTGGPSAAFAADGAFGDLDDFLFHVHRGMLEFVGYEVLAAVVTFGPAHLDDDGRRDALASVRAAFADLDRRPGAVVRAGRTVDAT
ncbi:MAG: NAD(P)H-dependent oxidoreductase [Aeromicrobium erythreum]